METVNKLDFKILEVLNRIADKLENSGLLSENLTELASDNELLTLYLDTTEQQSYLFAAIYATQNKQYGQANIKDIAKYLGMNFYQVMACKSDFDALLKTELVESDTERFSRSKKAKMGRMSFHINEDVIEYIFDNRAISLSSEQNQIDNYEFVAKVSELIERRLSDSIDTIDLFNLTNELEDKNDKLNMIMELNKFGLSLEDRILFYKVANELVLGSWCMMDRTLNAIYDNARMKYKNAREIIDKTNKLMEYELLRTTEDAFFSDFRLGLSEKGIELFMEEDAVLYNNKKKSRNMIMPDEMKAKELFYNESFKRDVEFIKDSLADDKFMVLQERLSEHSLSKGVACIFYGEPGTGKTETAFQIAKATGRAVVHVDISQTKSMWFGESEKKIKEIFDEYRFVCKRTKLKPILLFNEADAVFGKRKESVSSSTSQTENAIQNIILEEMEKLDGILIATTNLSENLDAAFERRFLFKLKFNQPDKRVKKQIWKDKLPWLDDFNAENLSGKFDFSGGEIDNIVRKTLTEEILSGNRPDYDMITRFCENEKISSRSKLCKVGF